MATVTVTIGRNVGTVPMDRDRWRLFRQSIRDTLVSVASDIYVDSAQAWGEWDGTMEECATWVASVPSDSLWVLRDALPYLASTFSQEAIALTVGTTELVEGK